MSTAAALAVFVAAPIDGGTGLDADVERALDLTGLFVFAVSGAMLAVRRGFDVVGVVSLALVTALGGGVLRDVFLGVLPPRAFQDVWYLVVPLAAAVVVFFAHPVIDRSLATSVRAFDAAGLGLFCVAGAVKASALGASAVGAVLIGVLTATGGGILRDVLANDQPQIFRADTQLYAIPATLGSTVVVIAWRNDFYSGGLALAVAVGVTAIRLGALRFGWRAPKPNPTGVDP